jgi:hypothetical protein
MVALFAPTHHDFVAIAPTFRYYTHVVLPGPRKKVTSHNNEFPIETEVAIDIKNGAIGLCRCLRVD